MKVLFICTGNAARSQFAEAIYNSMTSSNDASSAGTEVIEGKPLPDDVIAVLDGEEISSMGLYRKQLNRVLAKSADKIYLMTDQSVPDYLGVENLLFWDIEDPRGKGFEAHRQVFNEIKNLIEGIQ